MLIENFIPPEEKNKMMDRVYFDGEEEQWRFQPILMSDRWVPTPLQPRAGNTRNTVRNAIHPTRIYDLYETVRSLIRVL